MDAHSRGFSWAAVLAGAMLAGCSGIAASDDAPPAQESAADAQGADDAVPVEAQQAEAPRVATPVLPDAFPPGFLFGTAIAGFQVEMGCPTLPAAVCEDRASDWFQWITTPRIVNNPVLFMSKDPPRAAPGFFELYEADLDRAAYELHNGSLRLSLEWSRIFPRETFGLEGYDALRSAASAEGLAYYHRVLAAMRARGLTPLVTLSHYSLPLWIHDGNACNENLDRCARKGWVDRRIVPEMAKFAGFAAREFGGEVDLWATLNEPFSAVTLPGYLTPTETRVNPPGLYLKGDAAKTATAAMIVAHARMYDAVKAGDIVDADGNGEAASVGLVYAVTAVAPNVNNRADRRAAADARYFLTDMFLRAVARGELDARWDGKITARPDLAGRLDWLGVNYYARIKAQATRLGPFNPLSGISPYLTFNLLNLQMDMTYPEGIYEVLVDMTKYGVPLYVSETGVDQAKDPEAGARWAVQTLSWVRKAMADGVDVRGYYAWSLMDNYEWNHGMKMRFGLYAVEPDDATKGRLPRAAVPVYGRIAQERRVPEDLVRTYGAP